MVNLQHQILKAKKRHGEYCYHIKQFILTSANPYYNFHILFIYYILYFPLGTCTLFFHVSLSFLLIALESMQSISVIYTYFVKGQSLVS